MTFRADSKIHILSSMSKLTRGQVLDNIVITHTSLCIVYMYSLYSVVRLVGSISYIIIMIINKIRETFPSDDKMYIFKIKMFSIISN